MISMVILPIFWAKKSPISFSDQAVLVLLDLNGIVNGSQVSHKLYIYYWMPLTVICEEP